MAEHEDATKAAVPATASEPQSSSQSNSTTTTAFISPASSERSQTFPPIITYPEFLTTPRQATPLITAQRLLTTLYLFGSLSIILYGTTTYLVAPMVQSLTSARHTLLEAAQANMTRLISKLEASVSQLPAELTAHEEDESDDDPAELFHRDIGVQTSLPTTPDRTRSSSPTPSPLDYQTSQLSRLTSHIKEVNEASISEGQDAAELSTTVDVLREYLNSLAYVAPVHTFSSSYSSSRRGEENDEISKLKAQIRGVKGVLLSAKSFPSPNGVR